MQFYALSLLTLAACAAAQGRTGGECPDICVDAVQQCGAITIPYGKCYPSCQPELAPKRPVCPGFSNHTMPRPTGTMPPACNTTKQVCVDLMNSCGQMYGGCFRDCKPYPTFVPPPCPSTTFSSSTISSSSSSSFAPALHTPPPLDGHQPGIANH